MNYLHVIDGLSTGGSEHLLVKHVEQLANSMPDIQNQVIVLGTRDAANEEYIQRLAISPIFLDFSGRYRDPLASVRCIWKLRRLLHYFKPSLIHSYKWNANVFAEISRKRLCIPHVVHVVDRRGDRHDARWMARNKVLLTGLLFHQSDIRFAAVSDSCREHAIQQWQIPSDRIITAHNGIPILEVQVADRRSLPGNSIVIGTISNFTEEKGHRYLLEAVSLLKAQGHPFQLRIAGYGHQSDQSTLEDLALHLGVEDQVSFVGSVPSSQDFYREIDLFVIPSIFAEGLPTTILEAMAAQLPVVATDVGGAIEAVRDGIEGLIIPPRNPDALAKAISSLAADPIRRRSMGQAGLSRVRHAFSIDKMTATIVDQIYRPLLESQSRGLA